MASSQHQPSTSKKQYHVHDVLNILNCDESEDDTGDTESEDDEYKPQSEDDSDSEDDSKESETADDHNHTIPSATIQQSKQSTTYRWKKKKFDSPDTTFTGPKIVPPANQDVATPLEYFRRFITDDILGMIVEHTNLYSVQKSGRSAETNKKELEQLLGAFLHMGLVQMPNVRMYWETETSYSPVSSVMSRNRFQYLMTVLHFVDNMSVTDEMKKNDKLWKIRSFLTKMRETCLQIVAEEYNAVDEMMCQYKGTTSSIRQYLKSKPHPWGFKIWGRAGISGMLYDFDVYQGGTGKHTELGQGADVVLKLTSTLPFGANYKIFADNLFTGIPLLLKLKERGMNYVGTIRKNRLANCTLEEEAILKKKGRGAYDYRVEGQSDIAAVVWYDNKPVTLVSTYVGVDPVGQAKRWNKKDKKYTDVAMPAIISEYNTFMGGIDKLDSFLAKYRFRIKSRRWYMYLFWHFIMVAIVNAWLWYRRDYTQLQHPQNKILKRRQFQASVAQSLIMKNAHRRGRPSLGDVPLTTPPRRMTTAPEFDIRFDNYGHWPQKVERRGRCKLCEKNQTTTQCTKCSVRLCFVEGRNCFWAFHRMESQ